MTPARKRRIWEAYGRACGRCRTPVPMRGHGVTYDHHHQLAMDGPETDENCWPLCDVCVGPKNKADAGARAKVKRLQKKPPGQPKAPGRIKNRGFQQGHRKIPRRPFPKRAR